jgi:hypothetical protein
MNDLGQIVGVYENPDVTLPDPTSAADARADSATGAAPGRRQTAGVLARLGGRGLGTRQR